MSKLKLIIILIFLFAIAIFFITNKSNNQKIQPKPTTNTNPSASQNEPPQIISTNPDPLENATIPASGTIEITFNKPLQNVGEFKFKVEPKIDIKIELSSDRKTAKITPNKPYELGAYYTIFIGTDTKFDGAGNWGQEKIFHFKTISYRGV